MLVDIFIHTVLKYSKNKIWCYDMFIGFLKISSYGSIISGNFNHWNV